MSQPGMIERRFFTFDFLEADLASVTASLGANRRFKPASSETAAYFAQGARPKYAALPPPLAVSSVAETSLVFSHSVTTANRVPETTPTASGVSVKEPSPIASPLRTAARSMSPASSPRLGKGVSLQQLAQQHRLRRETRSQSPSVTSDQAPGPSSKLSPFGSPSYKHSTSPWDSPQRLSSFNDPAAAKKPSLSSLSSLAKAHSDATNGSLLDSLRTLDLTRFGTRKEDRHLGEVLNLPDFELWTISGGETPAVEGSVDSLFGDAATIVEETSSLKRFRYRRQTRGATAKNVSRRTLSDRFADAFDFATPSPDDVVREKQKRAFERAETVVVLPMASASSSRDLSETSDGGKSKNDGSEKRKERGSSLGKSAPDDWESRLVGV